MEQKVGKFVRKGDGSTAELSDIKRILAALNKAVFELETKNDNHKGSLSLVVIVRQEIQARRCRDRFFDNNLFSDPSWDMILDLFLADLEDREVAVSSLCIAAASPPTTALRIIKMLTDQGVFIRQSDPDDGRRVFIRLSNDALASINAYFKWLRSHRA